MTPQSRMLEGRRGLILGLANEHSIAWHCARLAVASGAELVATCLNDKARKWVEPLTGPAGIDLVNCDVEQPGSLEALVEHAAGAKGLDFVIHSIAWAPLQDLQGRVVDSSGEGFTRAMAVSCHSFARLARLCEPHLRHGGTLIAMSYLGAVETVPQYGLMGPVKAALESLVRYMAVELGSRDIRVHAVSPGPIATRAASGIPGFDALLEDNRRKVPLGRLATAEEVAALCVFLCSDGATGMTGQTLYVDAGYHILA